MEEKALSGCLKLIDVTDVDETARIEELATVNEHWTEIVGRYNNGESIDVKFYRKPNYRIRMPYRKIPIAVMMQTNIQRSCQYQPIHFDNCGNEIELDEMAIWSGGKHYCMECGRCKYSEPADEEGLMCTRCGEDIEPFDDIWGFDSDSGSEIDICMCSRCAYLTHRYPPWEQLWKET